MTKTATEEKEKECGRLTLPLDLLPSICCFLTSNQLRPMLAGLPMIVRVQIMNQLPHDTFSALRIHPISHCLRATKFKHKPSCLEFCNSNCAAWARALIVHLLEHKHNPADLYDSIPGAMANFTVECENRPGINDRLWLQAISSSEIGMGLTLRSIILPGGSGLEVGNTFDLYSAAYLTEEGKCLALNGEDAVGQFAEYEGYPMQQTHIKRRKEAMLIDAINWFSAAFDGYIMAPRRRCNEKSASGPNMTKPPIRFHVESHWDIFTGYSDLFRQDRTVRPTNKLNKYTYQVELR